MVHCNIFYNFPIDRAGTLAYTPASIPAATTAGGLNPGKAVDLIHGLLGAHQLMEIRSLGSLPE